MIQVGDMVEVVEDGAYHLKGEKFTVVHFTDECFLDGENNAIMKYKTRLISPLKTEAEERGAKFGVGGIVKSTGSKWVFACEIEGFWKGIVENGTVVTGEPHQFRLDHEPEYREIPFSEATHWQRMEKDCVAWRGHTVSEIVPFQNGSYGWTIGGEPDIMWNTDGLTVRVPT